MSNLSNWLKYFVLFCVSMQTAVSQLASSKMVIYWGQDSVGDFTNVAAQQEKPLQNYCQDSTYDIIVVAFVYLFPTASGNGNEPGMNFAGHCETPINKQSPKVLNCTANIAPDIKYCQSRGKKIFLSFGGGEGTYGFSTDAQGTAFATTVWNMFLGGSGTIRPFGDALFDGVDLDIEQGTTVGYIPFINQLRQYFATASKPYYISSAPQCFYPDLLGPGSGTPLSSAWFDYIWIQFYNNDCGLDHYPKNFNFQLWATTLNSINPNVKLFIGAPASSQAAGTGYVQLSVLQTIATAMASQFPSIYGGVMLWDASNSDFNANFGGQVAAFVHQQANFPAPASTTTTTSTSSSTTSRMAHPITTGKNSHSGSSSSTTTTSSTSSSSTSSTSQSGSLPCLAGSMACLSSNTYHTCAQNGDGSTFYYPAQSCQQGLSCHQSGIYIYCY